MKKRFAKVVFGLDIDIIFDYLIPDPTPKIRAGMRVLVPFGRRNLVGYVVGLSDKADVSDLKEIIEVLDTEPILSDNLLKLTHWMADYYFSSWGMAIKIALPSGIQSLSIKPKAVRFKTKTLQDPYEGEVFERGMPLPLNTSQEKALREIKRALKKGGFSTFLLHGPTGSGKREIYMQAIAGLSGGGAIILVPEIRLTPRLVTRFRSRFGGKVAVLHSGLTERKRLDEWKRIQKGDAEIAIGVRSAIFAPFKKVGLIIVDEEHDPSYKQEEGLRYHGRDLAIMRGKIEEATVILSSATPSVESFYNAKRGKYRYLSLPERTDRKPPPSIFIVDMRKEPRGSLLSERLKEGIRGRLSNNEKALIFLNRRGYSPFLLCRECGFIEGCPNCSITLTYHLDGRRLLCHYCGYETPAPTTCPGCGGIKIGLVGAGTERVEEELKRLYPDASVVRMDRDTIRRKTKTVEICEAQILLGTQMVVKGDHTPSFTLASAIWADGGLRIPDFRASERTFQLMSELTQRAGELIIQTHNPEHYSLRYVKDHDYQGFYNEEIKYRKELCYPPFCRLVRIIISEKDKKRIDRTVEVIKEVIKGPCPVEVLGPVPPPLVRLKGRYRYHMILKGRDLRSLHDYTSGLIKVIKERGFKDIKIDVDMDPVRIA